MSPEQAAATAMGRAPRTNVYGPGAVLYRASRGSPPSRRPTFEATIYLNEVLSREPVALRALDPARESRRPRDDRAALPREGARPAASERGLARRRAPGVPRGEAIAARPVTRIERVVPLGRPEPDARLDDRRLSSPSALGSAVARGRRSLALERTQAAEERGEEARASPTSSEGPEKRAVRSESGRPRRDRSPPPGRGGCRCAGLDGAIVSCSGGRSRSTLERDRPGTYRAVSRHRSQGRRRRDRRLGRVIELDPSSRHGLQRPGPVPVAEEQARPSALADFVHVTDLEPRHRTAWRNQAEVLEKKGDAAGARAVLDAEIKKARGSAYAWRNRAWLRALEQNWDGALSDLTEAIRLNPKDATSWFERGCAKMSKNDPAGAIADFTHAIGIDPHYETARTHRVALRKKARDWDALIADCTTPTSRSTPPTGRATDAAPRRSSRRRTSTVRSPTSRRSSSCRRSRARRSPRAAARLRKNDVEGAIADATKALRLQLNFGPAFKVRGAAREKKGQHVEAIHRELPQARSGRSRRDEDQARARGVEEGQV